MLSTKVWEVCRQTERREIDNREIDHCDWRPRAQLSSPAETPVHKSLTSRWAFLVVPPGTKHKAHSLACDEQRANER